MFEEITDKNMTYGELAKERDISFAQLVGLNNKVTLTLTLTLTLALTLTLTLNKVKDKALKPYTINRIGGTEPTKGSPNFIDASKVIHNPYPNDYPS